MQSGHTRDSARTHWGPEPSDQSAGGPPRNAAPETGGSIWVDSFQAASMDGEFSSLMPDLDHGDFLDFLLDPNVLELPSWPEVPGRKAPPVPPFLSPIAALDMVEAYLPPQPQWSYDERISNAPQFIASGHDELEGWESNPATVLEAFFQTTAQLWAGRLREPGIVNKAAHFCQTSLHMIDRLVSLRLCPARVPDASCSTVLGILPAAHLSPAHQPFNSYSHAAGNVLPEFLDFALGRVFEGQEHHLSALVGQSISLRLPQRVEVAPEDFKLSCKVGQHPVFCDWVSVHYKLAALLFERSGISLTVGPAAVSLRQPQARLIPAPQPPARVLPELQSGASLTPAKRSADLSWDLAEQPQTNQASKRSLSIEAQPLPNSAEEVFSSDLARGLDILRNLTPPGMLCDDELSQENLVRCLIKSNQLVRRVLFGTSDIASGLRLMGDYYLGQMDNQRKITNNKQRLFGIKKVMECLRDRIGSIRRLDQRLDGSKGCRLGIILDAASSPETQQINSYLMHDSGQFPVFAFEALRLAFPPHESSERVRPLATAAEELMRSGTNEKGVSPPIALEFKTARPRILSISGLCEIILIIQREADERGR